MKTVCLYSKYATKSKLQLTYEIGIIYSNNNYKIEMFLMLNDVVQV